MEELQVVNHEKFDSVSLAQDNLEEREQQRTALEVPSILRFADWRPRILPLPRYLFSAL